MNRAASVTPARWERSASLEVIRRVAEHRQLPGDKDRLTDIYWTMTDASICGLGQTAASAVLSALKLWPELFEKPVSGKQ